ncbi:MAG TPA: flagellar hook-associated protein FlgL [Terriglobales bacterium]|nr:flagellar hook-associated protein FlgL [Terriglobales bacterium]
MRVNPDPSNDILAALTRTQQEQERAAIQLASGRRVSVPSDDPAAAAAMVDNQARSAETDQFVHSISTITALQQTADSTLSSVVSALTRAINLGVQGSTGTLSDANRQSLAEELRGIKQQLLSLANLSFQGSYVFAGTATQTQPFVADASTPSGVRYDGNQGVNRVTIGDGFQVAMNQPGSDIFTAPGADVFQSVQDMINALESNGDVGATVVSVRAAFDHVSAERVFYGNTLNQMDAQETFLKSEQLQLASQQNSLVGVDLAEAASRLANATGARNAAVTAVGKMSQMSLFDYLT